MGTYLYELPTTRAVSFTDFCVDKTSSYTVYLADTNQARANLRAALKESKHTDGAKDYLRLVKVVDDYLPYLYGTKACFNAEEITFSSEPSFSWRSTLSASLFNNSPHQIVASLYADISFTLLTYAFSVSNLARTTTESLGRYEYERMISETERKEKDEKLNFAVTLLCRASGIYKYLTDNILPEWDKHISPPQGRPIDLTQEVLNALSKMALADAQLLAIRKLLSKSTYDSTLSPGPPLPKLHPSPALIAKLYLECVALYSSAHALACIPGSSGGSKPKGSESDEITSILRYYLSNSNALCTALARKWLGVDAGENGGAKQAGTAVAFLTWARDGLEELLSRLSRPRNLNLVDKELRRLRESFKNRASEELENVNVFRKQYKTMNDAVHFQPVPPTAELQALIPAGRMAVATKPFVPPTLAFGPGSVEHAQRQTELLELSKDNVHSSKESRFTTTSANDQRSTYAGAGSYF